MPNGKQHDNKTHLDQRNEEVADSIPNSIYTGSAVIQQILAAVERKQSLLNHHAMRYFCRAIMAGVLIGLFFTFSLSIKTALRHDCGAGLAGVASAIAFSFGLVFIFFTNSELLTSNFMYFTVGQYYKKIRTSCVVKIYTICFLGNAIGCALIAALVQSANIFSPASARTATLITNAKTVDIGCWEIFVKGIFANFFINAAIVISMQLKEAMAKIIILMTGVVVFVCMGYEHVIANTSIFLAALFEDPESVNLLGVAKSTACSFAGNLVGGGLVIGLFYAYLNDQRKADELK